MKVFLVGHKGSKKILQASSYLAKKYLPSDFEIFYVNFGYFDERKLNECKYLNIGNFRFKGINSWSYYMYQLFNNIDDEYVIFSLDDYLLSKKLNEDNFNSLLKNLKLNENYVSAELSISPEEKYSDTYSSNDIYVYPDSYSFTVNTQYRVWKREYLCEIFKITTNPWSFEIDGSKFLNESNYKSISHCSNVLNYPEISSLSNRNKNKISVLGNKDQDIKDLIELGYLKEENLILGQWKKGTPRYSEFKNNQYGILEYIEDNNERKYYRLMLDKCLN